MKDIAKRVLGELLKDSQRSDRELAKVLGVSQPTVSRARNKLQQDGLIREFTIIPNFVKLGYEIMAISFAQVRIKANQREEAEKWAKKYPNVLLMARAEGEGKNAVIVSLHKDYADYHDFARELKAHWPVDTESFDRLLISLKDVIAKPFSLKSLAEPLQRS